MEISEECKCRNSRKQSGRAKTLETEERRCDMSGNYKRSAASLEISEETKCSIYRNLKERKFRKSRNLRRNKVKVFRNLRRKEVQHL
jgi:hypothetical protein